jgi:PIN domain nuclease of toxin-antitoxin system
MQLCELFSKGTPNVEALQQHVKNIANDKMNKIKVSIIVTIEIAILDSAALEHAGKQNTSLENK